MPDNLGDRIRARRAVRQADAAARSAHHEDSLDMLRAYIDEQVAAVHERIDKLEKKTR